MMTEIRILSRGGQGGVTAAKMLAYSGHLDGKYVQAIPKYGAERKGAPIFADVRISDEHVKTHAPVITGNTHSWIVLEPSLVETMPFEEMKSSSIVIINSKEVPLIIKEQKTGKEILSKSRNVQSEFIRGASETSTDAEYRGRQQAFEQLSRWVVSLLEELQ